MQEQLTQDFVSSFSESDADDGVFRTPSVTDSTGGAISENQARERGRMVKTADQVVQLAFENGLKVSPSIERSLLPTPNTMEHREIKTPEQIAELKERSPGGYRNLREEVIHNLPTPTTIDARLNASPANMDRKSPPLGAVVHHLPTPMSRDWKGDSAPHERNGIVQVDSVERAIFHSGEVLLGTPRATASESSSVQDEADAPKGRIEDQVLTTSWGKFEPAIRRWEAVTGYAAPAPTRPDGKDGAHRLSPLFTEWLMGLEPGWLTDPEIGLTRNEQLKACGNGVVPQQAALALRIMLDLLQKVAV